MRAAWDLSCLEMAITAAEPIRTRTISAFLDAFAVTGVRPDVFYGAYGLAENTASVTNRGQGVLRLDKQALAEGDVVPVDPPVEGTSYDAGGHVDYYGCGFSSKPEDRIRIVDPDTGVRARPRESARSGYGRRPPPPATGDAPRPPARSSTRPSRATTIRPSTCAPATSDSCTRASCS